MNATPNPLVDVRGCREAFHSDAEVLWQAVAEASARPALERLQTISDLVNGYAMPPEGRGLVETVADLAAGENVVVRARRVPDLARAGSGQPRKPESVTLTPEALPTTLTNEARRTLRAFLQSVREFYVAAEGTDSQMLSRAMSHGMTLDAAGVLVPVREPSRGVRPR